MKVICLNYKIRRVKFCFTSILLTLEWFFHLKKNYTNVPQIVNGKPKKMVKDKSHSQTFLGDQFWAFYDRAEFYDTYKDV